MLTPSVYIDVRVDRHSVMDKVVCECRWCGIEWELGTMGAADLHPEGTDCHLFKLIEEVGGAEDNP